MNKRFLFLIGFFLIFISLNIISATLNISLSDQGTDVKDKSTGNILTSGDLSITIYDALSGGNLIYNETFVGAIVNGSWNVMLGENSSNHLPLEFGKIYYKDYAIDGSDLDFIDFQGNTVERQFFYSPLGDIAGEDISINANLQIANLNVTNIGLFDYLGSLANKITKLFVTDIDAVNIETSGNIGVGGDLNVTGKIYGDASVLNVNNSDYLGGYNSSFFMPRNTSIYGSFDFNGGWLNNGLSIIGGDIFVQTGYFYNLTSLEVSNLSINGSLYPYFNDTFDIGGPGLRWKDIYIGGGLHSSGIGDNYFMGNVGIGTTIPSNELEVNGSVELTNLYDNDASNFFDGTCTTSQGVASIDSTGTITCQTLAVTDTDCTAGQILLGDGNCADNYDASADPISTIAEWQGLCTDCVTDEDVVNTITASNYVRRNTWTDIDNYPTGCGTDYAVRAIGDTLTCINKVDYADQAYTGDSATGFFSTGTIATAQTAAKCTSSTCNDAVYSEATIQSVCTYCIGDAQIVQNSIDGTEITDDILDFVDFQDTLDLDASTQINVGTGENLYIDLDGTADFIIRDVTTIMAQFLDNGDIQLGNNNELYVDTSAGRVGIGDSTPSYKLDVAGTARVTGVLLADGSQVCNYDLLDALSNPVTSTAYTTPGQYDLTLNTAYDYALFMSFGGGGAGGAVDYPNAGYTGGVGGSSGVKVDGGAWIVEAQGGRGGLGNPSSQRIGAAAAIPTGGSGGSLAGQPAAAPGSTPAAYDGRGGYGAGTSTITDIGATRSVIGADTSHVAANTAYQENGNGYAGNSPAGGGSGAGYDHTTYYAGAGGGTSGQLRVWSVQITGQSYDIVVGSGGVCSSGGMDRYGGPGAAGAVYLFYA